MADNFFEYTKPCPECRKAGKNYNIGFEMGSGKIHCGNPESHFFEHLPDDLEKSGPESAPISTSSDGGDIGNLETQAPEHMTQVEQSVSDARLSEIVNRNESQHVTPIEPDPEPAPSAPRPPVLHLSEIGGLVGLGGCVPLGDGTMLCGVRVSESWVSAMQSEAESRVPPITVAEYLQELLDQGLIDYYSPVPVSR